MSQTPYSPMYYAPTPGGDPRAAARRAGVAMLVLGILAVLLGGGVTAMMSVTTEARWNEVLARQGGANPLPTGVTFEQMKQGMIVLGVLMALAGLLYVALGIAVRGASRGVVTTAIVLNIVVGAVLGLNFVSVLALNPAGAVQSFLLLAIPGVLIGLSLRWLFEARRTAVSWMANAPAMQQPWMMPPAGGGYGYSVPPPPPSADAKQGG